MATIRSILQIQDNMSRAFQPIAHAIDTVIDCFDALEVASNNVIDTASLEAARRDLNQIEVAFNEIEREIRQADRAQENLNSEIHAGTSAANDFLGKLLGIAAAYLSLQSLGDVIRFSDEMTNIEARLNLVVESLPAVDDLSADVALNVDAGGLTKVEQLQQQIFDAAQRSLAPYDQTADLVGKIGMNAKDAFNSTSEVVAFAELLNKQFSIAGTNAEGVSSAVLQLNQALGSGVLRGEEFNSVFEAAPNIIHTIADYLGEPIARIREIAEEGKLSADVVKNAMFSSADSINDKFNSMPFTFQQIWTEFRNNAIWAFKDVLKEINNVANSARFAEIRANAAQFLHILATGASYAFGMMTSGAALMYDNWSLIAPIIGTASVALSIYTGTLLWHKASLMATSVWASLMVLRTNAQSAAATLATGATFAQTVAQHGLNAALYACPLTWIILALIAVIGVIYLAVAALNRFVGTSLSATGMIAGAFMVLGAYIHNQVAFWWNIFASFYEFAVNAGTDMTYSVKRLFYNIANTALDMSESMIGSFDSAATNLANMFVDGANTAIGAINWIIDALNEIPGVELGKIGQVGHTASVVDDYSALRNRMADWVGEAPANYWEAPKMEMKSFSAAWDTGYNWGANLFDFSKEEKHHETTDPFKDILAAVQGVQDGLGDVAGAGKDTAGNTARMANTIDATEEEIKSIRDAAIGKVENRFITQQIKVDARSENSINSELDLDGIIGQFVTKTEEAMQTIGEGV